MFEQIANAHSAYTKFSFNDLIDKNLSWILLNWKLKVISRPIRNNKVTIKTWISYYNHIFTLREYEMYDDQNNLCAIAESKFCLIDLIKSKIARLPENLGTIYRNL